MNKTIEVAEIKARGNRIEYLLRDGTGLGILNEKSLTAWIEYRNAESFGFAAENVPEAILAVPIALYLYPATWFYGVDLILPALDKALCEDLDTIYGAYSGLHGPFKAEWRGKVVPARVEESAMPPAAFERLVFFSGGVDAAHAAINNAGPKNVLASVPSVEEAWNANKKRPNAGKDFLELKSRLIRDFSEATKSPWVLVANNFTANVFDGEKVECDIKGKISTPKIYFSHMVRLGNLLSAAPFAWAQGIRTLVMGSSYKSLEGKPEWNKDGDSPELSDAIKFADVSFAQQDGFYACRTEKVRNIVNSPIIKEYKQGGDKNIALWACRSNSTVQCCKCNKCVNTQLILLAAGENPRDWGFARFDEKKLERIVRSYRYIDWYQASKYWEIMGSIDESKEYPYCNRLLHWFKRVGWREYDRRAKKWQKLLKALRVFNARRYPHYAYVMLRRLGALIRG